MCRSGVLTSVAHSPREALQQPDLQVHKRENDIISAKKGLSLKSLSISGSNLPDRPGYGTLGRSIVLRTNYFHLLPKPDMKVFKYSVEIVQKVKKPDPEGKVTDKEEKVTGARRIRRIFTLLLENTGPLQELGNGIATDYKSMVVTSKELNLGDDGRKEIPLTYYEKEHVLPGQTVQPGDPRTRKYIVRLQTNGRVAIPELLDYLDSTPASQSSYLDGKSDTIQALNIIIAQTPNSSNNVVTSGGNKFFLYPTPFPSRSNQVDNLGGGLIALKGYYSSVRTSTLRVLLNVNVCTSAFYPAINLLELFNMRMQEKKGERGETGKARNTWKTEDLDYSWIEPFIKKLRISTNHIKKDGAMVMQVKTIRGFSRSPRLHCNAKEITFLATELPAVNPKIAITVEEYYFEKYKIRLRSPDVALIDVGAADKSPTYLPPELCQVFPGQIYKKKLSDTQTSQMIKCAAKPPEANAQQIMNKGLDVVGILGNRENHVHNAFGLKVEPKMISVNGRILASPRVLYSRGKDATPRDGSWNMINIQFTVPVAITEWSYIKFNFGYRRPEGEFQNDLKVFRETLNECGMSTGPLIKLTHHEKDLTRDDEKKNDTIIRESLKDVSEQRTTKILLIILPDHNAVTYARVKYWADVVYGIHTVCVVGSSTKFYNNQGKKQKQYCANVALKFNLKRGGVNQSLPADKLGMLQDGKTMVVGIDVTHPSPGSIEGTPSIAGVVASIDKRYAQWPASIRPQESRQEMVQNLEQMVVERLGLWKRKNSGKLPEKILVYRDGVSEGQYETVLKDELPRFQKACARLYGKMRQPKISIIVVGKRHHTRFYPTSTNDANEKGNPKNGTVVDRGVTMERGWDFFLQAHAGIQGTARPAHYIVIRDEIGLGADALEQMVS